jgi:uncharacterized protein HemX
MKSIRWVFPLIILIMTFILWRVYLDMAKPSLPIVPDAIQQQLTELADQQVALKNQVQQLQNQINSTTQGFNFSEIYYYLNTANMHLMILRDVKTALEMMRWVENRLKVINAPLSLQEALAADIEELKAAAVPHVDYVTQKINEADKQILTLPLRSRQEMTTPEPQATGWKAALSHTWNELKSLIRIQPRNTSMDYVLFDETILRETVRVELQRASIAAVLGQTDLYQASLQQADLALKQFFAQDDQGVQQTLHIIQNLTDQRVVPDIPKSDRALTWLQAQEQQGSVL